MRAEPLNLRGAGSPRPALTAKQTRLLWIVLGVTFTTVLLSYCFWWPRFSDLCRFAFLCCFPAGIFLLGLACCSQKRDRKFFPWFVLLYCTLLGIAIYLWRVSPAKLSVRNGDFALGSRPLSLPYAHSAHS